VTTSEAGNLLMLLVGLIVASLSCTLSINFFVPNLDQNLLFFVFCFRFCFCFLFFLANLHIQDVSHKQVRPLN